MARHDNALRVELGELADVDELVLAYRRDGELHELASRLPPATAEISGRPTPGSGPPSSASSDPWDPGR